jgi:hypothetical protein
MVKSTFALVLWGLVILLLAPASPARAQSAVACGCYCGITISPPCSEQACKDACGWRGGAGGGGGGSTQLWYCRALAPNGASGWAWSSNPATARQSALGECQQRARGCVIEACRVNDPSLARAPQGKRPTVRGGQATPQEGWCGLCSRKLQNDVTSGWASGLIRLYVGQAIAGYQNCKQKAGGGTCAAGDRIMGALRACHAKRFSAYRDCISGSF